MASVGFRWLDILEKEFDKAFVDLDLSIGKYQVRTLGSSSVIASASCPVTSDLKLCPNRFYFWFYAYPTHFSSGSLINYNSLSLVSSHSQPAPVCFWTQDMIRLLFEGLFAGELDSDEPDVVYNVRQKLCTLSSCFAQLTHKAQTIFQNSTKIEVIIANYTPTSME